MVPGLHCGSAVAAPHMRMNKGLFGAKRMYLGGWQQRCGRNKKAPIKTSSICIRNNRNTHGSKQRQQQQHVCSTKKERTALQHVSQWLSTHGFNFKQVGTKTLRKQAIGNLIVISQAQALHILRLLHYRMFLIKLQTIRARFLAFCRTPGAIHVALFFFGPVHRNIQPKLHKQRSKPVWQFIILVGFLGSSQWLLEIPIYYSITG